MKRRNLIHLLLLFIVAAGLTFSEVPLASSQGITVIARRVSDELPLDDPASPLWQQTTAIVVPLSAQTVSKPMLRETRVKSISVRALHNDQKIAFLTEWEDETQNSRMVRVQDFRDAVALQFPQVTGQPFFCMGMQGGNVNIWHWKADWQADMDAWQDMESQYADMNVDQYPFAEGEFPSPEEYKDVNYVPALAADNLFAMPRHSPVEDLLAGGFGTLTAEPADGQNVQGYGVWEDNRWRVIFSRDLVSEEADDASFKVGQVYSVAFAAWDGDNEERNGEKSTSQWVALQLESQPAAALESTTGQQTTGLPVNLIMSIIIGVFVLLFIAGVIIYLRLPNES